MPPSEAAASRARPWASTAWLSVVAARYRPIPTADQRQPEPVVVELRARTAAASPPGPTISTPSTVARAEREAGQHGHAHAAAEVAAVAAALLAAPSAASGGAAAWSRRPGRAAAARARSSARRRSARRARRSPVSAFTISTPELRIACSETMITSTAPAKPSPCAIVNSAARRLPASRARAGGRQRRTWPPERPRHDAQAEQRRGGDRDRGDVLALEDPDRPAARRTRPARPTPSAPGRRRGRSAGGRRGSRARSSSPHRRGPRPTRHQ